MTFPTMKTLVVEAAKAASTKEIFVSPELEINKGPGSVDLRLLRGHRLAPAPLADVLPPGVVETRLGAGSFGTVYRFKPDDGPMMALKISEDEPEAYEEIQKIYDTAPRELIRHLPKIYAAWLIPESGRPSAAWLIPDSGLVITLMEYLEPLPIKMEKLLRKAIITGKLPDYSLTSNVDAATAEFIGVATFYHAMEDLIDFQNIEPDDLHHGNIMVRPTDKSLVVSDIGLFR